MRTLLVALALGGVLVASQGGLAGSVRSLPAPDAVVRTPQAVPLLAADGRRVAFTTTQRFGHDVEYRVDVWSAGAGSPVVVARDRHSEEAFAVGIDGLALAGVHLAWTTWAQGNGREQSVVVARVGGKAQVLDELFANSDGGDRGGDYVGGLHGGGSLIVANTWTQCDTIDYQTGETNTSCRPGSPDWISAAALVEIEGVKLRPLHTAPDAMRVADVDRGRIVVREDAGPVSVRNARGALLRRLPFPKGAVLGAQATGPLVVVLKRDGLWTESGSCPLAPAPGRVLAGAGQGAALLVEQRRALRVIRLADCRELRLAPTTGTIGSADLTDAGLFYARNGSGGSVAFVSAASLRRGFD